jgi:hypothetical protein
LSTAVRFLLLSLAVGAILRLRGGSPLPGGGDGSGRTRGAQIGWQPVVGQFTLFLVEVADLAYIGSEPGTGAQHVARWPPGEEYIRPQLTPTSLGLPQAVSRLLTPDS